MDNISWLFFSFAYLLIGCLIVAMVVLLVRAAVREPRDQARHAYRAMILGMYKNAAVHQRALEKASARRVLTREEERMVAYFRDQRAQLERFVDQEINQSRSHTNKES